MKPLAIELKVLDNRWGQEFPLPCYATQGSAGLDLRACTKEPLVLRPGKTEMIPSGLAIFIGQPGYVGLLLPRSGLGSRHGIVLGNLCGVIDADYNGEILMALWNRSEIPYTIQPGERVCQLLIVPVMQVAFKTVAEFSSNSIRQDKGFGSTGSR